MKIIKKIDNTLNKITMYRIILYCLIFLFAAALSFSFFNLLPFKPIELIISAVFIMAACFFVNAIFALVFRAPSNIESVYITALILTLVITPPKPMQNLLFLTWVSVLAMTSKYIIAFRSKHIFNPVAIALVLITLATGRSASWWIANLYLAPFVIIGGCLVVKKIKRFDMVGSFFIASLLTSSVFTLLNGKNLFLSLEKALIYSPILFFAFIMLTEPMTVPPTKPLRILYGAMVGFLFVPEIHIGSLYFTPELALVIGNIFSYLISPEQKLILTLEKKERLTTDIYDFEFISDQEIDFKPGQYMEWTMEHPGQDSRGIRRYLTIASSPTENKIRLGVKFYDNPSSYKKFLMLAEPGQKLIASQLAGDFTLPKDKNKKLVFIAGGIGITPFRSMIKYLLDKNEKRSIFLFYLNKAAEDIAYKDDFDEASQVLDIKVIYSIADIPEESYYQSILEEVRDYKERLFYISGPHSMVTAFENNLRKIGVRKRQIKTDYFPGFA